MEYTMKFKIEKSSDCEYEKSKNIDTLEELINFINKSNCKIIIKRPQDCCIDKQWSIEIYDSWRE
jgi:hypothetical protein